MKKSAIILCIAAIFTGISHANPVYHPIAHFSDDYHAMIQADGDTHKIHIYKKGQSQPIISQDSELSDYDLITYLPNHRAKFES